MRRRFRCYCDGPGHGELFSVVDQLAEVLTPAVPYRPIGSTTASMTREQRLVVCDSGHAHDTTTRPSLVSLYMFQARCEVGERPAYDITRRLNKSARAGRRNCLVLS